MTVPVIRSSIEGMFDGVNWTDISADVLGGFEGFYAIKGNSPLDRIASPGELKFDLDNSQSNSGGKLGYYSPGNANCRTGFDVGLRIRVGFTFDGMTITKWEGKVPANGIKPTPGIYGNRRVTVTARDWMEQAANHEMISPAFAQNKSMMDVVALIFANMGITPPGTIDYRTGTEVFGSVFDTVLSSTTAMGECAKVALAELGYIYPTRNGLRVEGRYTRNDERPTVTVIPLATFDCGKLLAEDGGCLLAEDGAYLICNDIAPAPTIDSPLNIDSEYGNFYNRIKATAYPRRIDAAATTILFTLQSPMYLAAGATATISGNYKDPTGIARRVSGISMVTPVANTHYQMFANIDGTGTDLTANLSVVPAFGTTNFFHTITNTGITGGYITKFIAVGKGIYWDDSVDYIVQDDASILKNGVSQLNLDLKYQDDPIVAESFANVLLNQYKDPRTNTKSITESVNKSTSTANAFLYLEPGDRIHHTEIMGGVNADFYIQGVKFAVVPGEDSDIIAFTWYLKDAGFDTFSFGAWDTDLWDTGLWGF